MTHALYVIYLGLIYYTAVAMHICVVECRFLVHFISLSFGLKNTNVGNLKLYACRTRVDTKTVNDIILA